MLSMIVSVIWAICALFGLAVKAALMLATKADVEAHALEISRIKATYESAQTGVKWFWITSAIGICVSLLCYAIGLIKVWVVVIDVVVWFCCLIMNVVFLGYLKKKSNQ